MRNNEKDWFQQRLASIKVLSTEAAAELFEHYITARKRALLATSQEERIQRTKTVQALREKLANNFLRYVVGQARKRTRDKDLVDDLIGAGMHGLVYALDRYQPARGTRFLTYGAYWIRVKMDEVQAKHRLVHPPSQVQKLQRKRNREHAKTAARDGIDADPDATGTVIDLDAVPELVGDTEDPTDKPFDVFELVESVLPSTVDRYICMLLFGLRGDEVRLVDVLAILQQVMAYPMTAEILRARSRSILSRLKAELEYRGIAKTDIFGG